MQKKKINPEIWIAKIACKYHKVLSLPKKIHNYFYYLRFISVILHFFFFFNNADIRKRSSTLKNQG